MTRPAAIEGDTGVAGGASLGDRVRNEQIRALYEELPYSALGMTAGGLIVIAGLWTSAVWRPLMLAWIGLIVANQMWRLLLYRRFKRSDHAATHASVWAGRWALGALFSGVTWGSSALFMFDPGNSSYQAYLVICLIGVTAGALALVTIELRSFVFFILPTLLPIIVRLVAEGDRSHLWMAGVCTLVLCVLFKFGMKLNRELAQSLYNRFALDDQRSLAEAARAEAEIATQAKSKFLQATSHDLRNDVQAISLLADNLERARLDPAARDNIAAIAATARAVGRLADDLLSVSRLDAGDIRPALSDFGLQSLFDAIELEFRHLAAQQQIALSIEPTALAVRSDRMLLERIVRNLVSNALRYTPAHGTVTVQARSLGAGVRIGVRDTGIGIAAADQGRIFEEFYQVAATGPSGKGLGIGLSIVQRFAELLGHRLHLESSPGLGSCFGVDLPLATAAEAVSSPQSGMHNPLRGRLIVFVDDDPAVLGSISGKLTDWELQVIATNTSDGAFKALAARQRAPDLILADYQLGDGSTGIDLIDRMRRHYDRAIPAVLLTAHAGEDHRAPAAGRSVPILDKPVQLARLRLVLEDLSRRCET